MRYADFKILLEYDRSKTVASLGASIQTRAKNDNYLKSQNTDPVEAVISNAEETDPTNNKQYVVWIVKQYVKNNLKFEDIYKLHDHLKTFVDTKGQHKRLGINSDINQYNWKTLADLSRKLSNTDLEDPATVDSNKIEDAKILYNGPLGMLSIPETEAASCELGRGTEWCTAATKAKNRFKDYNNKGPLFIWHDKKKKTKYQFHFETGQIMDIHDNPVTEEDAKYLALENPITSKILKANINTLIDAYIEYLDYHSEPIDLPGSFDSAPDEEILDANLEVAFLVLDDNYFARLYSTALQDSSPDVDFNIFKIAWFNELVRRPQIHRTLAEKSPFKIPLLYAMATGQRSPEMEKILLTTKNNERALVTYAEKVINEEWPEAEPIIAKDQVSSFLYAIRVLKDRFPEGEPAIKQSERNWNQYKIQLGLS